jgi:uncharacterized protein YneF (UPF0154 family)
MPANPDSKLLIKASELIKSAPLDADLKLMLIEMIVRIDDDKLKEVLTQIENFTESSAEDMENLLVTLMELKESYALEREKLEDRAEQDLQALETEIGNEEGAEKIKQIQKKIQDI